MAAPTSKILLTGATGYVGGTVLDHLVKSTDGIIQGLTFDLLVRGEEPAQKLRKAYGDRVNPIQWTGLADTEAIASIASNYDIVVNVGSGFIPAGAGWCAPSYRARTAASATSPRAGRASSSPPWAARCRPR